MVFNADQYTRLVGWRKSFFGAILLQSTIRAFNYRTMDQDGFLASPCQFIGAVFFGYVQRVAAVISCCSINSQCLCFTRRVDQSVAYTHLRRLPTRQCWRLQPLPLVSRRWNRSCTRLSGLESDRSLETVKNFLRFTFPIGANTTTSSAVHQRLVDDRRIVYDAPMDGPTTTLDSFQCHAANRHLNRPRKPAISWSVRSWGSTWAHLLDGQ